MAAATHLNLLSYEEYLRTPEMKKRFEIIDGVLEFMSPAPNRIHQETVAEFHLFLSPLSSGWGKVYLAPFDVIITRRPLRTRQPDLFLVGQERLHIVKDQVEEGPDVVLEILSPSNRRKQVLEKLADYASINVRECWMADTEKRTLQIWRNENGLFKPQAIYRIGQKVRSKVFPAFTLPATVFPR
jgi:Uma2 family endonuclease